jgi:hypothetical protein
MSVQSSKDEKQSGGTSKPADPLASYYGDSELARIFRRSKRTIARWRAERKLPYTLAGKTPYSSLDHVQQMLRANEIRAVRRKRA